VGPGSRAARDKAAYEASFGPFYRVSQLILSTTAESNGSYVSTSGMPGIVTDDNIRLLFDMQDKVDVLSGGFVFEFELGGPWQPSSTRQGSI
jgi:Niemann-Pick C1 protein